MFKDDDEEEENTFGVTRYPCMPSLVALQQMRTRLHLAFLGRKLMKWTALATGREMRRLASELYNAYQGFGEDMRDAFIMLARCRYFVPQLNSIVTENINKKAGVIVQQSTKAVSGVKIVQFEVFETDSPPYAHLGIEKGGQAILEAKKAWLDLLKRLLMMMQLRESFLMVEVASKNATKKWNVLSKLVVPRLNLTCRYIISELEEIEREDNFRLKRFKELKIKKTKGKEDKSIIAETCECIHDQETKEQSIELIDHREITSPIENSSTQGKDKEENKTCPICKDDVKQKELNNYEENNCPTCKNNEIPNVKSKEVIIQEQILKVDNLCPTCKNKSLDFIDPRDTLSQTEQSSLPNNVCASCKYIKSENENNANEFKKAVLIDQRDTEKKSTKYCPACKPLAIKNNTFDCGNIPDIDISESDELEKDLSETCSLCEKMGTFGLHHSSCRFKSNIIKKQTHQTCTDDTSENVETINEIVKFKRIQNTDGNIHEEIKITTRRTQKYVLPGSPDTDKYIKETIDKPEKLIKQTKFENKNKCEMNGINSISSVPTKVSCSSTCSNPISQKHSKNESLHSRSQNSNSSQYNTTCIINRVPENDKKSTTKKSSSNFMICKNTEKTESNGFLTKSLKTSNCSQDITKVKSDNNSCCNIKIKSKDKQSKNNSDVEEIELTPSTIVILRKILSYTNKSNVGCKFNETDKNQSQKSNTRCKAKASSDNNSIKSEPCMRKEIQESFNKKLNKTEPICTTCKSKDVSMSQEELICTTCNSKDVSKSREEPICTTCNSKDVSKSQEDILKQDRILPCCSRSNDNSKPEKLKLDPSIKPCLPANIKSQPETNNKISSCKQEKRQTIEQKTEHTRTGTKICQESDNIKESTHHQKISKNASKSSCETKACQTRQQHQSHESKEKSKSNKNNKSNSKESCCACKEKLEDEVQKTCSCSKTKPIPHTPKAKPKSSKIVIKLFDGSCSCKKPIFNSVHLSSSKQSNQSNSCTGTAGILSKVNQTCLMDRLSDDDSYKSSCLCLKNSNLKDIKTESEKMLSSSKKSQITTKKGSSDPCICKKNSSANSSVVEKKNSDVNKSVSRECSCVSEKTKKIAENYSCACRQAKIIRKSKETEIKKECQSQINAHSKPGMGSFEQLKSRNSCKIKEEPKSSCKCSSKKSIHRRENKDTVSSISQICTKCLSRDQDLKSKNEECYCMKHKPKEDGHYATNHGKCSCSSIKTDLSDTVSLSRTCTCQTEKTTSLSYKQECSKTTDVKNIHGCSCKKTNESKQPCSYSKSDTSSEHSETSGISSKTCKGAEPQSSKSKKGHSGECSCRSSKNKIESYSEKSLVKTNDLCRKCNSHKANREQRDTETCQVCKEKSKPCSCKETKPNMTKTCKSETPASPNCPCESSKQSPSIASSQGTEFISVDSQTCSRCASIQTSQKSIRFSHDASPTRIIKSDSSVPTGSSCSLKSCLLSQSSQLSFGKKDVSTSTKRSDRYDVRTLRHLAVEPKKLDCRCQSDSALLKIKNPKNNNSIGKCCSLHNSKYFRY